MVHPYRCHAVDSDSTGFTHMQLQGSSADAHEMAGETSIHLLGLKHVNEWVTHCARVTKTPPSGMLYLADVAFEANVMESEIDSVHMLAKDITPQHKCNVCGGDSHTASFYLNGEKIVCPKLLLFPKHRKSTNEMRSEHPPLPGACP